MSGPTGEVVEVNAALRERLDAGLRRIAYFVVPSAMAFLALGDVVTGVIYQTGRFGRADSIYVWAILAGAGVGLLATTSARLYAATFYALRDTRTPLRFAVLRVALTTGLGYLAAFHLPARLGIDRRWGVAGLTAASGIVAWLELALLRRSLGRRIGSIGLPGRVFARLFGASLLGAAAAWGVKLALAAAPPLVAGLGVLAVYGAGYLAVTWWLHVDEARGIVRRVGRRRG
jgi:putative peptidoglycan lipid II flippase